MHRSNTQYYLAQANYARWIENISPHRVVEFTSQIDDVNALAASSPGFVWRYQGELYDAEVERLFEDKRIVFNMSVWESVEALKTFSFKTFHADVMKLRRRWFEKLEQRYLVMWWIPASHRPTVEEAWQKFQYLNQHGPGPEAFSFIDIYPAPVAEMHEPG